MKKVILDECLPRRLKTILRDFEVVTVPEAGFAGEKNGDLLEAIEGICDVFVTIDANLESQQNLSRFDLAIIVLHASTNRFADLESLTDQLNDAINNAMSRQISHIPPNS